MPQIREFPETYVAYVAEVGPYDEAIPRGFERLFDWLKANGIQPTGPSMGIFYDDPSKVEPQNQRCDLCAPVGPEVSAPDQAPAKEPVGPLFVITGRVRTKRIGGWRAASINYQGRDNAAEAYNEVYDWLHREGYLDIAAPVEIYPDQPGVPSRVEICIPIKKKERVPVKHKMQVMRPRKPARKTAKKATKRSTVEAVSKKPGITKVKI